MRLLPLIVTETLVPCNALGGVMPVTDGAALFVTVKLNVVEPPFAVSVMGAIPTAAADEILNVAVIDPPLDDVSLDMSLNVRPGQVVDRETPQRLVPLSVMLTTEPRAALACESVVTVGAGGGLMLTGALTLSHGLFKWFLTAVNR